MSELTEYLAANCEAVNDRFDELCDELLESRSRLKTLADSDLAANSKRYGVDIDALDRFERSEAHDLFHSVERVRGLIYNAICFVDLLFESTIEFKQLSTEARWTSNDGIAKLDAKLVDAIALVYKCASKNISFRDDVAAGLKEAAGYILERAQRIDKAAMPVIPGRQEHITRVKSREMIEIIRNRGNDGVLDANTENELVDTLDNICETAAGFKELLDVLHSRM